MKEEKTVQDTFFTFKNFENVEILPLSVLTHSTRVIRLISLSPMETISSPRTGWPQLQRERPAGPSSEQCYWEKGPIKSPLIHTYQDLLHILVIFINLD